MDDVRREKIAFAKSQFDAGIKTVPELQKAVRAKFDSGISFRDLGAVFPESSKKRTVARKAKATKRRPGRPRGKQTASPVRRGLPAMSDGQFLLVAGDNTEAFASEREVERRVHELVLGGHAPSDLAVFKRHTTQVSVTLQI